MMRAMVPSASSPEQTPYAAADAAFAEAKAYLSSREAQQMSESDVRATWNGSCTDWARS